MTPAERSVRMALIRSRDTKPELIVRRLIHSMGYRYRLHRKNLPGCPDLAFASRRAAIFVDGCFWHLHRGCCNNRPPKSRLAYWRPKLERNVERDSRRDKGCVGWMAFSDCMGMRTDRCESIVAENQALPSLNGEWSWQSIFLPSLGA